MVRRSKSILGNNDFTPLFDKGYHTGSELEISQNLNIKTLVAIPSPASNAPDPRYNVQNFTYDPQEDHYTCPQDHFLKNNGTFYDNHRWKPNQSKFKQYKTKACNGCPVLGLCTTAKNGKLLSRNIYTPVYEQNRKNMEQDPELYRRRQAIVEHPFGTIKRQWVWSYPSQERKETRLSRCRLYLYSLQSQTNTKFDGQKRVPEGVWSVGFLFICLNPGLQCYFNGIIPNWYCKP